MFIKFKCSLASLPIGLYFKESFLNKEAGKLSLSKYFRMKNRKLKEKCILNVKERYINNFVLFFINQKQAKETSKGLQRKFFNRINFPPYAFTIYYRKKLVHRSVSKNNHCR